MLYSAGGRFASISMGGSIMWITSVDLPPGSDPSNCPMDGRCGETGMVECIMWTTTPRAPPGNDPPLKTLGIAFTEWSGSEYLLNHAVLF